MTNRITGKISKFCDLLNDHKVELQVVDSTCIAIKKIVGSKTKSV